MNGLFGGPHKWLSRRVAPLLLLILISGVVFNSRRVESAAPGPSVGNFFEGVESSLTEKSPGEDEPSSHGSAGSSAPVARPETVQAGDIVSVHFTIKLEDGRVVRTTRPEMSADIGGEKALGYEEQSEPGPTEIIAGESGTPPGLGSAVVGMHVGESRTMTLPPEQAFGESDPSLIGRFPCSKSLGRILRLTPEEYVGQLRSFPLEGARVRLLPYFDAIVRHVSEKEAEIEFLPNEGDRFQDSFGETQVSVSGDTITMTLSPKPGAVFEFQGRHGRIIATDGAEFAVDFNHPMKGKTVVLDLEVVSLTKVSAYEGIQIEWIEDYNSGLSRARSSSRGAVLVLYADWCAYCNRLFNESFTDPRIRMIEDRFVWIRVNSDKNNQYREMYGQNGFPLTVLLGPDGSVVRKIDGFRDGAALLKELTKGW